MSLTIAIFGEAKKGAFHTPLLFETLEQLAQGLGEPLSHSDALPFALQSLLHTHKVLYFRVHDEGFSLNDYLTGLRYLESIERADKIDALYLPGVGDEEIMDEGQKICYIHKSLLITREVDFYDYLTQKKEDFIG